MFCVLLFFVLFLETVGVMALDRLKAYSSSFSGGRGEGGGGWDLDEGT